MEQENRDGIVDRTARSQKSTPAGYGASPGADAKVGTTGPRVLMVDDDRELCRMVTDYLDRDGFSAACVHSGAEALTAARDSDYDVIILDIMMPGMSGQELLRRLTAASDPIARIPVLMLSARGDEVDRVLGLELGADDYLAKPCSLRELAARLRALLRRATPPETSRPAAVEVAGIRLDATARTVSRRGRAIKLTSAEFLLLQTLMEQAGRTVSKERLMERALGRKYEPYDRSIDVHIGNLRGKLAADDGRDSLIKTIRGRGYLLVASTSDAVA